MHLVEIDKELKNAVYEIFRNKWTSRDGKVVPEQDDIQLGNDCVKFDGTVLYADLDGSTDMVDRKLPEFSAEIYKSYLFCAAKIIRNEGGVITAYDGDRIMAVFIGDTKNSDAAKTALKINYTVKKIINPAIKEQYIKTNFEIKQVVGIDTSPLLVARIGVKGFNDLVWVGRAANYAAKLTTLSSSSSWITDDVYKMLLDSSKLGPKGEPMWIKKSWSEMNNKIIYCSNWTWAL